MRATGTAEAQLPVGCVCIRSPYVLLLLEEDSGCQSSTPDFKWAFWQSKLTAVWADVLWLTQFACRLLVSGILCGVDKKKKNLTNHNLMEDHSSFLSCLMEISTGVWRMNSTFKKHFKRNFSKAEMKVKRPYFLEKLLQRKKEKWKTEFLKRLFWST